MRLQRWLSIGAVIFIAYSVIKTNMQSDDFVPKKETSTENVSPAPASPPAKTSPSGSFVERQVGSVLSSAMQTEEGRSFLSQVIQKAPAGMEEKYVANMQINDVTLGTGEPVICGQTVGFHYRIQVREGTTVFDTRNTEPTTASLGKTALMRMLEQGMLGMRVKGIRELVLSAALAKEEPELRAYQIPPGRGVIITIELLSAQPPLPASAAPMQVFEAQPAVIGAGCRDTLRINYSVRAVDGTLLLSNKGHQAWQMTLLDDGLPVGLAAAIQHLPLERKRTVILPPEWMAPLYGTVPSFLAPHMARLKKELSIWEIERVQ